MKGQGSLVSEHSSQGGRGIPRRRASPWRKTVAKNGLTIITEAMPSVRSLSMAVVVGAGPQQDPEGKGGLAHLVEHLMFQGTRNRDALAIARLMDDAGGQIGAFTSRDYTCYYATALDDYRTYALELLGDILQNSLFPEEALCRQQGAIICEIEGRLDSAEYRAEARVKELAWGGHPLGRKIPGAPSTVQGVCREDVLDFVRRHYRPREMIVAAAGRLDHDDFVAQVNDCFWSMGSSESRRHPAASPDRYQALPAPAIPRQRGFALEYMPLSQASFALGIPAGPYSDPERYSLFVLDRILGGGLSSRLFRRLREEEGVVYDIGSEVHSYRDAGMWLIRGSTMPQHLAAVLETVLVEVRQLLTGAKPPDEEELERARRQLTAEHLLGSEDPQTRMSRLVTQQLYFGRHLPSDEIVDAIGEVGHQALGRRSQALWTAARSGLCLAIAAPESPQYYGTESLKEILRDFDQEG